MMGNEACKEGYACVYGKRTGTGQSCMLPRCKVMKVGDIVIDELANEIRRSAAKEKVSE